MDLQNLSHQVIEERGFNRFIHFWFSNGVTYVYGAARPQKYNGTLWYNELVGGWVVRSLNVERLNTRAGAVVWNNVQKGPKRERLSEALVKHFSSVPRVVESNIQPERK